MGRTLADLTSDVTRIFAEYDKQGTVTWDYRIAASDLPYQLGSLTKAISQLHGERYAEGKTEEQLKRTIADELADIMAEVLFIAQDLDIDLESAWEGMLKSDTDKIKERTSNK
ncbi:MAG: hypothetical protein WCO52_04465 [bacterium]